MNAAQNAMGTDKTIIIVEQNSMAQFGALVREQTGLAYDHAILKYDGRPIFPEDIIARVTAIGLNDKDK